MSKDSAFILILIMAISSLSLLIVKPAYAQATPKASVPQFTLKFVDNSYDVPPVATSTTDPYTGKTTTSTTSGYHVTNKTVEIIITNQHFAHFTDGQGNDIQLYYNISGKGHFENNWYSANPMPDTNYLSESSPTTVITIHVNGIADGGEIDYRIEAQIGYYTTIEGTPDPLFHQPTYQTFFTSVATSDWSNTQTITIQASSTSSTPSVPEFPWLILLLPLLSTLSLAILISSRRISRISALPVNLSSRTTVD